VTKLLGGLPALAREIEHTSVAMAWMQLKPFPGYTSYPSLATTKAGEFFVEQLILPLYEEGCQKVLWGREQAPKAQFQWLRPVAGILGGRV
jgi:creatinine amidohydrolase